LLKLTWFNLCPLFQGGVRWCLCLAALHHHPIPSIMRAHLARCSKLPAAAALSSTLATNWSARTGHLGCAEVDFRAVAPPAPASKVPAAGGGRQFGSISEADKASLTPPPETGAAIVDDCLARAPVKVRWDLTPEQIGELSDALIAKSKEFNDQIVKAAEKGDLTWKSIVGPSIEEDAVFGMLHSLYSFPAHLSPDKALRDASVDAARKVSDYGVEAGSRKDVFEALKAYSETAEAKALTGEEKRCLHKKLLGFRRRGLDLEESVAAQVKKINKRLGELSIEFSKNLNEESTKFFFTAEELKGVPPSYLEERKQEDGTYKVTLQYPCYIPLMERCAVPETRQKMEKAFNSRCLERNTEIIEELVQLRAEKAKLMGYKSHADFITEDRMSGSAAKVESFLSELATKLAPLLKSDLETLKAAKKADGYPDDCQLEPYDRSFYAKRVEEATYQVDHEKLKEYFPLPVVTEGVLGIYQGILGLKFEPCEEMAKRAWHKDVLAYKVTDSSTGKLVGFFYMDMHPREGKFGHAACFGIQSGCEYKGEWQVPIAALVCNFPKATKDQPGLLSHSDVETFFHEFGHVMHQLCSEAKLSMFAGTSVERDFVEAPSQMLENWVWQPSALRRMSKHYKTNEPIPDELLDSLLKSRNFNSGMFNMRQVVLATFDQTIHTRAKVDTAALLSEITEKYMTLPTTPGTNMAASFGHIAGGYDAQYYGYLWSEVYSADMFASRFESDIFSPVAGASYRKEVLAKGGSRDAIEHLRAFLGRDPSQEPFLKAKGLAA